MPAPGEEPSGGQGEVSFSAHLTKDWLLSEMRATAHRSLELQLEQQERLIARFLDHSLPGVRREQESPDAGAQKDAQPADQALVLGRLPVEPYLSSSSSRPETASFDEALKHGEHGQAPAQTSDAGAVAAALSHSLSSALAVLPRRASSAKSRANRTGHKFHIESGHMNPIWDKSQDLLPLRLRLWEGDFDLKEPERSGALASVLMSSRFQFLCAFVIVLNGLVAVINANAAIQDRFGSSRSTFWILETVFLCFYAFELVLKLLVHRWYFFVNKDMGHNIFDLTIVLVDGVGMLLSLAAASRAIDVSFLRSLRIFKVTRMLRVLRAFEVFTDLRVLLEAMTSSVMSLFWCSMVIMFTLCMFSLLLVQMITEYLGQNMEAASMTDCGHPSGCQDEQLVYYFGSIQRSMLSLYMASTGGENWSVIYLLLEPVGVLPAMAFVIFTFLYQFGMFNLLTSMFVDRTMKIQIQDRETKIIEQRCREADQTKELLELMRETDHNRDGKISFEEFLEVMQDPATLTYLAFLGLPIADVKAFFEMLVAESGRELEVDHAVPIEVFVQGCMRMKGMATSIDMQALKYQTTMLADHLHRLEAQLAQLSRGQRSATPAAMGGRPRDPSHEYTI